MCGGPVTRDYDPASDFHSIELVLQTNDGSGRGSAANFTLQFEAADYLVKNDHPDSARITLPNGRTFQMELSDGQTYLCNSIGASMTNKIVLGGVFLQNYYNFQVIKNYK